MTPRRSRKFRDISFARMAVVPSSRIARIESSARSLSMVQACRQMSKRARLEAAHVGFPAIFFDLPVHTSCTRGLLAISKASTLAPIHHGGSQVADGRIRIFVVFLLGLDAQDTKQQLKTLVMACHQSMGVAGLARPQNRPTVRWLTPSASYRLPPLLCHQRRKSRRSSKHLKAGGQSFR